MSTGLVELAQFIHSICQEDKKPEILDNVGAPPGRRHILLPGPDGYTVGTIEMEPGPRNLVASALGAFIEMLTHYRSKSCTAVFVNPDSVVAVLDDGGWRHSRITMPLRPTPAMRFISAIVQCAEPVAQLPLLRTLQTVFDHVDPATLVGLLKKLRFVHKQEGAVDYGTSRESIDRSVLAECMGLDGDGLPETITLAFSMFENFVFEVSVHAMLVVNIKDEEFRFHDIRQSVAKAVQVTLAEIADTIRNIDSELPVFVGWIDA